MDEAAAAPRSVSEVPASDADVGPSGSASLGQQGAWVCSYCERAGGRTGRTGRTGREGGRADDDEYKQSVFELGGTGVSYMNGLLEKRRRGRS